MSDQMIEPPAPGSEAKATVALVLGIVSAVCLVVFALLFVFGEDRLDGLVGYALLLPCISVIAGSVAIVFGVLGWVDARRGAADGLRRAQAGTILGGVSVGIWLLCLIAIIIGFAILVGSWNEGVD
jgi:hypothetical protein